jgi:hypothetical protein
MTNFEKEICAIIMIFQMQKKVLITHVTQIFFPCSLSVKKKDISRGERKENAKIAKDTISYA